MRNDRITNTNIKIVYNGRKIFFKKSGCWQIRFAVDVFLESIVARQFVEYSE
jgi:hypothetical protein